MTAGTRRPICYYNGACPVCGAEIERYRRSAGGAAIAWCDLSLQPTALGAEGIDPVEAKRRLHVRDGDGRLHAGVDAFLVLWRTLPGYRRLARLLGAPVVRPLAVLLYDRLMVPALFAWNRRNSRI